MATSIDNARAIIDAIRDYKGKPPATGAQALRIVERYASLMGVDILTSEEKAETFLNKLWNDMVTSCIVHAKDHKTAEYHDEYELAAQQAADDINE